jgi:hypothetical protein
MIVARKGDRDAPECGVHTGAGADITDPGEGKAGRAGERAGVVGPEGFGQGDQQLVLFPALRGKLFR